ncbi:MAG: hypothetical protein KAJ95_10770, partial [Gammaproteobacteria bacterium]|nr:hypothetical protein [Gammaproteobacteria bacterium]
MHRTPAVVAALLLFAVSSGCFALGLGEIDMQSALNQPMQADIELTSASATDLSEIKVTLASRDAHQRLGLGRAGILSNFKFSVEKGANGKPLIRVTSHDSVREPFLEFLLQVEWPNGKLMRQYTVLVDPPVTMAASPAIAAPPVSRTPVATPVRETSPQSRPATTRSTTAPSRPATVTTRAADEYGPIRRSETLWEIAKDVRPDRDISMDQMMIALQRANPQAFIRDNINNLKMGVTLRVPGRDEILSM